jgi:hypothetical protein
MSFRDAIEQLETVGMRLRILAGWDQDGRISPAELGDLSRQVLDAVAAIREAA